MKFIYTLLLALSISTQVAATDKDSTYTEPLTDICQLLTTSLENWVEGQVVPGNTLFLYFNTSQGEFEEFLDLSGVTSLDVEVTKVSDGGATIEIVETATINDPMNNFQVENWSLLIENVDTLNERYFVEVKINGETCSDRIEIPLVVEVYEEELEELEINLPEFTCGEVYDPEDVDKQTSLSSASVDDVFFIGGFPILIKSISVNSGDGIFSGTGIIPVPFDRKVVAVEFENVQVNEDSQIWDGEVTAVSDDPDFYLNFDIDNPPLSIGGDICVPDPPAPGYNADGSNELTGLDDNGFDPETGLNEYTGEIYDSLGFDIHGNTPNGTRFNECNCSRDGFTPEGGSCNPDCGPSEEVLAYVDSVATNLGNELSTTLNVLATDMQVRIQELGCDNIRQGIETLVVDSLEFEERYIFGENREYIDPGLHLAFEREPKPVILNTGRDKRVKRLENKHIALYKCDKTEYPLKQRLDAVNLVLADEQQLAALTQYILSEIENWTLYQYGLYTNDPSQYQRWLLRKVGDWVVAQLNSGNGTGSIDLNGKPGELQHLQSVPDIFDFSKRKNTRVWASTAANLTSVFNSRFTREEASELFRSGAEEINGVHRAFYLEELAKQQRLTATGNTEYLLPLEVTKTAGNLTYTIYLDGIRFTPETAYLNAYIIITDPETNKRLAFSGINIPFGPTGTTEESRLYLENDVEIRLNNAAMLVLNGGPAAETYVAWNCEGFQSMGIDAQVEFCRNFITPLHPVELTPLHDSIRYRLDVSVQNITSWLEFTLEVNAPPFAITKHENVKWELTKMILDFSSSETPEFIPIDGYTSPYWDEETRTMSPLWKGFYMERLSATLPNKFTSSDTSVTVYVNDLLIDGSGVTVGVEVENLIDIGVGNMGGWPFSITDFKFRVIKNRFAGAGLGGEINIPLFGHNTEYEAVMYPGNIYSFAISPMVNSPSDAFLGIVEIDESSEIRATFSEEDGFHVVATLTGKLSVGGSDTESRGGILAKLPQVCFQEFKVGNKAPYFEAGTWGIVDTNEVAERGVGGFPIRLSKVVPFAPSGGETVGLKFNLDLLLAEEVGVNAGGSFRIEGELDHDANGRQKWKFKRVGMDQFRINASFPGAKIAGLLEWYDDTDNEETWGKGFRGLLDAEFKGVGRLQAAAQFGRKEDYKYFFVDAMAEFGAVAPGIGVLQIKGFGGGISYHMDVNAAQVDFSNAPANNGLPLIGKSFSGASYVPNKNVGLGLKATAIISTLKEEVFSGTVSLLFQFNTNNGFDKIAMLGSVKMLSAIDLGITPDFIPDANIKPAMFSNPIFSGYASIEFDFGKSAFHGNLNMFINALGIIKGVGNEGRAVTADIHFDPEKWYIYIGKPNVPGGPRTTCGTVISILDLIESRSESYFCIGSIVPASPPLPQEVRSIAYKLKDNPSLRQSGAGLIFGASRQIKMDIAIAGIIDAKIDAKFGYDVMLRKYDGFVCQSDGPNNGQPIGLNGWYAAGQAYAYIYGELKVFGVNVASAGIAAALQARLPNPFYAQAVVGLKLKIGFIKVKKSLSLELGNDNCTLVSDNPGSEIGMEVIVAMTPLDLDVDVETITVPEATLAMELDRDYTMASITNGVNYQYRVELNEATLTRAESGVNIPVEVLLTNDNTLIQMKPLVEMPGGDSVTFTVKLDVFRDNQFLSTEEKSVTFMTAERMDYIPEANVKSAYPADGMYNFYKDEYVLHEGFIQLETGQPQLLTQVPYGYNQRVRLTSSTGEEQYISYNYNYLEDRIEFPLVPEQLMPGEYYRLELIRRSGPTELSTGTLTGLDAFMEGSGDEDVSGPNPGAENNQPANETEEKILYSSYFRVSTYETFEAKINAIMNQSVPSNPLTGFFPSFSTSSVETFDALESVGKNGEEPLVSFKADFSTDQLVNEAVDWITEDVTPFLMQYHDYGCTTTPVFESLDIFASAIKFDANSINVTFDDWKNGTLDLGNSTQKLSYQVERAFRDQSLNLQKDQKECLMEKARIFLLDECLGDADDCPQYDTINDFSKALVPVAPNGSYKVKVEYRIPSVPSPTSSIDIFFVKQ